MISNYLKESIKEELGKLFKDGFIPGQNLLKKCLKKFMSMDKTKEGKSCGNNLLFL